MARASLQDLTCSQIGHVLSWIFDPTGDSNNSQNDSFIALEKAAVSTALSSRLPSVSHLVKIITCSCRMLYSKLTESENIWYALNRFQFRVDPKNHRKHYHWPNVSSPRQLHAILSTYAPLEGFYVCANPFPIGLLFVLRFRDGKFVAELVSLGEKRDRTNDDGASSAKSSVDKRTQIMSVSFSDGKDPQISFCGCAALMHRGAADLTKIRVAANILTDEIFARINWTDTAVALSLRPFLSRPDALIIKVGATASMIMADKPEAIKDAWYPFRPNKDPRQLLMSLLSPKSKTEIALAYLYGPTAVHGFLPKPDMPAIRPGLYVGSYGEINYVKLGVETRSKCC